MRVTYLYHSGFLVENQRVAVVFDYCRDDVDEGKRALENGVISPAIFTKKKGLVLVSHAHDDHYNSMIFKWRGDRRDVAYVVDADVPRLNPPVTTMRPGDTVSMQGMKVKAFGSTDLGCSFLVDVDGVQVFHAGDLNFWHWKNESTPAEVAVARQAFMAAMDNLEGERIDLAFFPVDARMGEGFPMGADYFAKRFKPQVLVPMHFTALPKGAALFSRTFSQPETRVWLPQRRGDSVWLFEEEPTEEPDIKN